VNPGEIYYADFGGTDHHRIFIVSREELNRGNYVVAVPFTSSDFARRRELQACVPFLVGEFGCTKDCVARADNITLIDKSRIQIDRGIIDTIDDEKMREIIRAIGYVISSECEPID
jgi:mRNA-degrading endonuclease toxin of MazEF toxin-antitoxin module